MTTKPLSPYAIRQLGENLRCFDAASALRQIDIHIANGLVNESDAAQLRRIATDRSLWMF